MKKQLEETLEKTKEPTVDSFSASPKQQTQSPKTLSNSMTNGASDSTNSNTSDLSVDQLFKRNFELAKKKYG